MVASLPDQTLISLSQLYEQDYCLWLEEMAKSLLSGHLEQLDRVKRFSRSVSRMLEKWLRSQPT